nr:hypothetical protein [Tanacetum cinerariifolium]
MYSGSDSGRCNEETWNRITNLSGDDVADFVIALKMFTKSLVIQKRVGNLQLGVERYQKKINVTKPDTKRPDLRKRHPYTPYQDPQEFIYVNSLERNRLMRSDKLYKLNDGTLTRLLTSLEDITKNIHMKSKNENKGIVPTEMELVLEQTQQGTSYEVSVSVEGVEELKRKVKIKGEKKEALFTLRQKPGNLCDSIRIKLVTSGKKRWCDSLRIKLVPVTHWFTPIMLYALKCSDNKNMLSFMNLIHIVGFKGLDGITTAQIYEPTFEKEKLDMKNEMKAKGTLFIALPNKDQIKFHSYKDAKLLMEAIEKRAIKNQENRGKEYDRKTVPVENTTENALIAQDGIGGYDWSYQAEEEYPTNYTLMVLTSSGSSSSLDFKTNIKCFQNRTFISHKALQQVFSYKKTIFNKMVNTVRVKDTTARERVVGNSQQKEYKEKGFIDNGKGRISCKGKIKTGTLDFDDVYFTKDNIVASQAKKKKKLEREYILIPICTTNPLNSQGPKDSAVDAAKKAIEVDESRVLDNGGQDDQVTSSEFEGLLQQERQPKHINGTNSVGPSFANTASPSQINAAGTPAMEEEVDINNVVSSNTTPDAPLTKFLKDHPKDQLIGSLETPVQIRQMTKINEEHGLISSVQKLRRTNHKDFQNLARIEAIRLFLADVSFKDFIVYQMYVKSAFLYGKIEKDVYVFQPPGFEDPNFPDKVYKVEKALYGLHQAPRACQEKYVADILKKFDFTIVKTASTPMEPNKALVKDAEAEDVDVHLYRSMIGSLTYLTASRPNITFVVCACARFQVTPKTSHLHAMKRIFRYLKGHPKLGLWYPRDSPFDLEAYFDSDYARASLDRKSTTGEYVAAASCCGRVLWIQNQMVDYGFNLMNTKIYIDNEIKTVNDDVRLQALVDEKKVLVNEASIRRDIRLNDAEGTACLPNDAIFEGLARMGYGKPSQKLTFYKAFFSPQWKFLIHTILQCLSAKTTAWNEFSSTVASTNQAAEIEKLKKRVKKIEGKKKKRTHGLRRLYKGRIAEIDANEDFFLINETAQDQGRIKDQELFRVHDLDGDEVFVYVTTSENVEQDATIAESVEGIAAATTLQISKDRITLAQTLMEIKAVKPKAKRVTIQEPSKFRTTSPPQPSQPPQAKDNEVARKLEAEMKSKMKKEERIAREKNEANRDVIEEWDDVQATIDVDRQLTEQIQAQEREQLSIEERSKLLHELIKSRKKYFAIKISEEIKNKPPTKPQQKSLMCIYMKNIKGFKQNDFKGKSFDDIKKMFDKVYKRVNTFMDMNTENVEESLKKTQAVTQAEVTKDSSKRAAQGLEQESAKKQKLNKQEQAKVADDDIAELKRCLEIVFEDDDDVAIEATPLSSKSPTIVDYKIYKEGKKSYFKIIRAYGNSQNYLTFGTMFKNFNR